MHRAHKIRLNPTAEQEIYFRKACGTARHAFNWGLAEMKRAPDEGRHLESALDLKKRYSAIKRERFPWVYEVTKCATEGAFVNLGRAVTNFRVAKQGKRKGRRMGFPRFKSRKRGYGSCSLANDKFSVEGHTLRVPKLGAVNMTEALRFEGRILGATISERAGWRWVSIQVEVPQPVPAPMGHPVGVDVGLEDLAMDSDGQRYENQAPLRSHLRRLKRVQRMVSRRRKGGANRRKAVRTLAKAHYRVACRRADCTHKLTTAVVRKASLIGIESLQVAGVLKNHHLALSLSDANLSEIHRQFAYKAAWSGGRVVAVDRFYPIFGGPENRKIKIFLPRSQIHHGCG